MTTEQPRHRGRSKEPVAVSRRRLIVGSGLAASLTAFGAEHGAPALGPWAPADWNDTNPLHDELFEVFRAEDAMVLRFRLVNMALFKPVGQEAYLRTIDAAHDRFLIVDFPPQSVGEQTYDTTEVDPTKYDAVPAHGQDEAGNRSRAFVTPIPTRLVFQIPPEHTTLRPALVGSAGRPGLLDWNLFHALTSPMITNNSYAEPTPLQTSIGAPFGLALATTAVDGWVHSTAPVTSEDGRTELWNTRLGATLDQLGNAIPLSEYPAAAPEVRAVWSPGFSRTANPNSIPPDSYQMPLSAPDRSAVVRLTSDAITSDFTPSPIEARRVILTSSGASLELHGAWTPPSQVFPDRGPDASGRQPAGINLSSWIHHSTLGRDNHVVVTYLGYLLPFGHPVALIKETQRRFELKPTGSPVAYLRTRRFIIIRKHDKYYGDHGTTTWHAHDGRDLPFRRVRINTVATPNLTFQRYQDPASHQDIGGTAFCIAGGKPFPFSVTAWDWEGKPVTFTVPMAFVTASAAFNPTGANVPAGNIADLGNETGTMAAVIAGWNALAPTSPLRTTQLGGHAVALADSRPGSTGESSLRFASMSFGLTVPAAGGADDNWQALDQPRANPTMSSGQARIPAVQAISPGATSTVSYDDDYVRDGFVDKPSADPHTWTTPDHLSVFLQVAGQKLRFAQGGAVGSIPGTHPGVITPDLNVGGISRNRGVVGGVTNDLGNGGVDHFKAGTFDPAAFLDGAKLLGGLELADIIAKVAGSTAHAPDIRTVQSGTPAAPVQTTSLRWAPDLQADPDDVFVPMGGASLRLDATFVTPADGSPATTEVAGVLRSFRLNMFGGVAFLTLNFNELSFHSRNGSKPTVNCDIESVTFGDELSFLNPLEDFLSFGDNGPSIVVRPDAVTAGITLALPSIGIGVFSLTNLSFTAAVEIPFTGAPARLRFGIASRERPFHVAVMIFSGGGWFDLAVGSDGVERMEIGLEFGGQFELDLAVASAGIEVMAGLYFSIEAGPGTSQAVQLVGYFKAHGELNLGPVGASFTFTMSLTYDDEGDGSDPRVWGEVDVSVEVHVAFIGGSVDFHFTKEFAGGGDPTFADMLAPDDYALYAGAFA